MLEDDDDDNVCPFCGATEDEECNPECESYDEDDGYIPNTDAWYPLAQVIGFIDQVNIFQEAKAEADIGWTETDSVDGHYVGGRP